MRRASLRVAQSGTELADSLDRQLPQRRGHRRAGPTFVGEDQETSGSVDIGGQTYDADANPASACGNTLRGSDHHIQCHRPRDVPGRADEVVAPEHRQRLAAATEVVTTGAFASALAMRVPGPPPAVPAAAETLFARGSEMDEEPWSESNPFVKRGQDK